MILKLKSTVMPFKLVETLVKKSDVMTKKLAGEGKPQVIPVFEFIKKIMEDNNLIPAWDELPEIRKLLRLKPNEEKKN